MEDDTWSFGLSTSSRSYQSTLKSQSGFCIDFDFEEIEGDDDLQIEYPCPFCPDDFDLVGLCCHIDEEHPLEAKSGVCPVCATRVEMNMVGHITTQHGNILKNQHRLKLLKGESPSTFSSLRKELEDEHFHSLLSGLSPLVSPSKMAPDPLLSFIYNVPTTDRYEAVQPDSSTEVSLEEQSSDMKMLERNVHPSPLSDKDHMEKTSKSEYVQGLLLSTIFDGGL